MAERPRRVILTDADASAIVPDAPAAPAPRPAESHPTDPLWAGSRPDPSTSDRPGFSFKAAGGVLTGVIPLPPPLPATPPKPKPVPPQDPPSAILSGMDIGTVTEFSPVQESGLLVADAGGRTKPAPQRFKVRVELLKGFGARRAMVYHAVALAKKQGGVLPFRPVPGEPAVAATVTHVQSTETKLVTTLEVWMP